MIVGVLIANLPSLAPYLQKMRARPSEPAPRSCNNEPIRKNTLDKYKCGPLDLESGASTLQDSECSSDGGKKTLKGELEDAGIIPAKDGVSSQSEEVWNDIEIFDAAAIASKKEGSVRHCLA
jgi:hypothetical protein